jgi:magnesium transporter
MGDQAGLPPGTLVHVGEKKVEKVRITVIDYDEGHCEERVVNTVEECFPFRDTSTVTWINVDGVHDVDIIDKLGACFRIHPIVLEDVVSTIQRPKMLDFGDYIFIVLKMLYFDDGTKGVKVEQVSLIFGSNFVISFQEDIGDVFDRVRDRIRNGKGKIRRLSADYLAYSLLD